MLRWIYLALAVLGTFQPMRYYIPWFVENGFSLKRMFEAIYANGIANGMAWELVIIAIALTVWILAEVYVRKDYWVAPICIGATFCIGVSCGLPLYLYLRARPIV